MFKYQALIKENLKEIAKLITFEQGKTIPDAEGDVMRGLQVNVVIVVVVIVKINITVLWDILIILIKYFIIFEILSCVCCIVTYQNIVSSDNENHQRRLKIKIQESPL